MAMGDRHRMCESRAAELAIGHGEQQEPRPELVLHDSCMCAATTRVEESGSRDIHTRGRHLCRLPRRTAMAEHSCREQPLAASCHQRRALRLERMSLPSNTLGRHARTSLALPSCSKRPNCMQRGASSARTAHTLSSSSAADISSREGSYCKVTSASRSSRSEHACLRGQASR